MKTNELRQCLALLRDAEDILLNGKEPILASHLSLVIERLAERMPCRFNRVVQASA